MTNNTATDTTPEQPGQLGRELKTRHLTMMGLGSAIGAGLFLGTGVGIKAAGPVILLAYLIAGVAVFFVMQMLGEMAAARPTSAAFASYAESAFGSWAGFTMGWLYWFMLIMVLGTEMTGAAAIMGSWFGVEPWIPAFVCIIFFVIVNFAHVGNFGAFEFWFAFIKVAVIVVFIIIGILLIFGLLPGHEFIGAQHFNSVGFMPNGLSGFAAGLLAVAFSFGGIEIVTIAAAESEKPAQSIKVAVRSTLWRIAVFYIGSVLIIIFLLPFGAINAASTAAESPFTAVLDMAGIPGIVTVMEVVIVIALLSAFNAQIFASSRMTYSMGSVGYAGPASRWLSRTNSHGVPLNSVIVSMVFAFASVGLQYWNPPGLLEFLLNAVGGCLIVLWIMVIASYLKLHPILKRNGEISTVEVRFFPLVPIATLVAFVALTLLMLTDPSARNQVISVSVVVVILVVLSFVPGIRTKGRHFQGFATIPSENAVKGGSNGVSDPLAAQVEAEPRSDH